MSKANGNLNVTLSGTKLILTIDTSATLGRSASGKTILVATTRGPMQIPGTPVKVILTAYRAPLRDRLKGRAPRTAPKKKTAEWGAAKRKRESSGATLVAS